MPWPARAQLIDLRKDLEGHVRGVLKTLGIRLTGVGKGRQQQGFRDQLSTAGERDPVLRMIADAFIAVHATLCQAAAELDRAVKEMAETHPVTRRLMITPKGRRNRRTNFVALIDDPLRFHKAENVGAFVGLTPRRS